MKPILFNTEMVRAILDGRKTQTRRVIKNKIKDCERKRVIEPHRIDNQSQIYFYIEGQEPYQGARELCRHSYYMHIEEFIKRHSQYQVGDILYVRETFLQELNSTLGIDGEHETYFGSKIEFLADGSEQRFLDQNSYNSAYMKKRPSIHMPKKYARIFLHVTNVRVERLQDITLGDIFQEGCPVDINGECFTTNLKMKAIYSAYQKEKEVFHWWKTIWNSTAKDGYKWEDTPYVFVYEFERINHETL